MKRLLLLTGVLMALPFCLLAQQAEKDSSLVEVSGVITTADSAVNIPGVSVFIKSTNRGTVANNEGVFTIVAEKGDTLVFSAVGFKKKQIIVRPHKGGHFMGLFLTMNQETTYLPPATVRSYPTREEFEEAFLHWKIPEDYNLARANTAIDKLQSGMNFVSPDGGEGVSNTFQQQQQRMSTKGQMPAMNIFNPLSWAKFIKAIKDGDFKRKD